MSSVEIKAPDKARPVVPSAMVMTAPLAPAPTHGAGRAVETAEATDATVEVALATTGVAAVVLAAAAAAAAETDDW